MNKLIYFLILLLGLLGLRYSLSYEKSLIENTIPFVINPEDSAKPTENLEPVSVVNSSNERIPSITFVTLPEKSKEVPISASNSLKSTSNYEEIIYFVEYSREYSKAYSSYEGFTGEELLKERDTLLNNLNEVYEIHEAKFEELDYLLLEDLNEDGKYNLKDLPEKYKRCIVRTFYELVDGKRPFTFISQERYPEIYRSYWSIDAIDKRVEEWNKSQFPK